MYMDSESKVMAGIHVKKRHADHKSYACVLSGEGSQGMPDKVLAGDLPPGPPWGPVACGGMG